MINTRQSVNNTA